MHPELKFSCLSIRAQRITELLYLILQSLFIVFFSLSSKTDLYAQISTIDSLELLIENRSNEDSIKADILNELAFVIINTDPMKGRDYATQAFTLSQKIEYRLGHARGLNLVGSSFLTVGDYESALNYYMKSLKLYEKIDDKMGIFITYNNVGELYEKWGNLEEALHYHKKSLALKNKYLEGRQPIMSHVNLGQVYFLLDSLNLSKEHFQKAEEMSLEEKKLRPLAHAKIGQAKVYNKQSYTDAGIGYLNEAANIYISLNDHVGMAMVNIEKAKFYFEREEYQACRDQLVESLRNIKIVGAKDYELEALEWLVKCDSASGEITKAFNSLRSYNRVKSEFYDSEKQKQIETMLSKFELEEAERVRLELLVEKQTSEDLLKYRTIILNSTFFFLVIISFVAVKMYSQRQKKAKLYSLVVDKNKKIAEQKEVLQEQSEKLKSVNQELSIQKDHYKADYYNIMVMSEIGTKITSTLNIETIIERVYNHVNNLLPADSFYFGVYNQNTSSLDFTQNIQRGKKIDDFSYHIDDDAGRLAVRCFKEREIVSTNDFEKDFPEYPYSLKSDPVNSCIMVPLFEGYLVYGVLMVKSEEKNVYKDHHIYILQNLAVYISIALKNAKNYEKITAANLEISKQKDLHKKNYESLKSLSKIEAEIISTLSPEDSNENISEAISRILNERVNSILPGESLHFALYNKETNSLDFPGRVENGIQLEPLSYHIEKDAERLSVLCFAHGETILTNDLLTDIPEYPKSLQGEMPSSVIYVPLIQNSDTIGVLEVYSFEKNAYTDYHIYILQNLAMYIGIALENAESLYELEKKLAENKILYDLSSNLIAPLELDVLLQNIIDAAVALVPKALSGSIYLLNHKDDILEGRVSHVLPKGIISKLRLKIGEGQGGKAVAENRNILENHLEDDELIQNHLGDDFAKPVKSIIVVLLKQDNKIIGTISVDNYDEFDAFTQDDLDVLCSLAPNASAAIERVRLMEEVEHANMSLSTAYEKLKELDDYKESMTAMIVHDFKNSLNTVISFSDGEPNKRRMKSIRQAGQFMLHMVLNILDVQKFETTSVKLSLANYPISQLINQAVDQLSYMIEQKSIKLSYVQGEELFCRVDNDLITRTIVNILSNAIKYAPTNGNIEIRIKRENGFVHLAIQDDGPGIPSGKAHMVFEKYSQINAKKSGSVRSTGIGLTFCKMVVEAHGGQIGLNSKEGEGSTFYFTSPIADHDGSADVPVKKIDLNEDYNVAFSKEEKKLLQPVLKQLQKWEVYDYSEVSAILETVSYEQIRIIEWRENLLKALYNGNEEKYNQLTNP